MTLVLEVLSGSFITFGVHLNTKLEVYQSTNYATYTTPSGVFLFLLVNVQGTRTLDLSFRQYGFSVVVLSGEDLSVHSNTLRSLSF